MQVRSFSFVNACVLRLINQHHGVPVVYSPASNSALHTNFCPLYRRLVEDPTQYAQTLSLASTKIHCCTPITIGLYFENNYANQINQSKIFNVHSKITTSQIFCQFFSITVKYGILTFVPLYWQRVIERNRSCPAVSL